jgi:aminoacrylate hydrolase
VASDAQINFDATTDADLSTAVARINMLLGFDRAEELGRIRAPVLIVGSSDDALVPVNHSYDLALRLPQARMVELQGGHFLPQTQTELYVAALESHFLEQA